MNRGDIYWYTFALPDKKRPVLVLTRQDVVARLNEIIVVPITTTIRGIPTEVLLGEEDGMAQPCAANFDHIALAQRARFASLITSLRPERWPEVRTALLVACGFEA